MADQIDILDLSVATDPTNGMLYIVISGVDYQISYDDLVQFLTGNTVVKAEGGVAVTTGSNVITFASSFADDEISIFIYDYQGTGIQLDSWTADDFTITSLGNGNINYIAVHNI